YMFKNAKNASPTSFDQDVSSWNVAHVDDFSGMFEFADAFDNGGVALDWTDVGTEATNDVKMAYFVKGTSSKDVPFSQSVATWRFGGVYDLTDAFRYAPAFEDDLAHWCIEPSAGNNNFVEDSDPLDAFPGRLPTWDCVSEATPAIATSATTSQVDVQATSPTDWATAGLTVSGFEATWTTTTSPTEWPAWTSLGTDGAGTLDLTVTGVDHRVRVRGVFVSGGEARYAVPTTTDVTVATE
ncbi:MAG: BspA family leucine-rich repeat surface protein, partial [Trueperaceae bacterium]|nr:BspA family leucine-rich repeat surface protein [Trueperaceae bacterium]